MRLLFLTLLALAVTPGSLAVKREDFKECGQTSFCRRLRGIADKRAASEADSEGSFVSPYTLGSPVSTPLAQGNSGDGASWTFPLTSSLYPDIAFSLRVDVLSSPAGAVRIRADEVASASPWTRYNETGKWTLLEAEPPLTSSSAAKLSTTNGVSTVNYADDLSLEIVHEPLKITMRRAGAPVMVVNDRSLFHMEHFRAKDEPEEEAESQNSEVQSDSQPKDDGVPRPSPDALQDAPQEPFHTPKKPKIDRSWFEVEDNDSFEESWKRWRDTKPKGPEGLSVDITFPGAEHVYGLPEHASPLSLPTTVGEDSYYKEPYRLWNVDIFEYLADSPMALYGAVPLLHAHSKGNTVGVLNLIASETWVDVGRLSPTPEATHGAIQTHWVSESGILDLLLLPGPRPIDLFEQYAALTGPAQMPPQWATAYHQCRWNYNTQGEVIEVDEEFDKADIPLDVTWLDIEYADEHRYFDWNKKMFPNPVEMLDQVEAKGRKMVAIVDPHIKRTDSFRVYKDALDLDILVKNKDGNNFDGRCWTGSSVWVDYFNPKSWDWWRRMFSFKVWADSTKALFIWNDMNEPSVFDGPEITMPKDNTHVDGWEHRDVHNLNGMMFHNQTQAAVTARESPAKRPFVLSRSFFAGSQRYGAIWIGDNLGTWDHLAGEAAMFLSNSIAGMSFVGADVGGFFGNPGTEMLVRWYQAGAFMPFFRAHAHIDTKRREPYLFDEPVRSHLRDAIRLRYQLLPVWYNAFHAAALRGHPVIWPQYAVFPSEEQGFAIDDQYYIGDSGLLFKPVVTEGATETSVYLADNEPYYNYFTHEVYPASKDPRTVTLQTPLDKFPLLVQGGHIVPSRQRVRRASPLMWQDPFTLLVGAGRDGSAEGQLYLDDGDSFAWQQGEFVHRRFALSTASGKKSALSSKKYAPYDDSNAWARKISHVGIERIVLLGTARPESITLKGTPVEFAYTPQEGNTAAEVVIKNPPVHVVEDWEMEIVWA